MAVVRRLEPEDASRFRALRLEARASDPAAFRGTLAEEAAKPLSWFEDRLICDPVFGAFDATDDLVGMAGYTPGGGTRNGARGRVWTVYVRAALRGQRIGEALIHAVIAHARPLAPVLHLSVMVANRPARALYERLGFQLTHIERESEPARHPPEAHYSLALR